MHFSFVLLLSSLALAALALPQERIRRGSYGRPEYGASNYGRPSGYGRPSYGQGGDNYDSQGQGGLDGSFGNGGANLNQFPNNNGGNFNTAGGFPSGTPGFNSGSDPNFG